MRKKTHKKMRKKIAKKAKIVQTLNHQLRLKLKAKTFDSNNFNKNILIFTFSNTRYRQFIPSILYYLKFIIQKTNSPNYVYPCLLFSISYIFKEFSFYYQFYYRKSNMNLNTRVDRSNISTPQHKSQFKPQDFPMPNLNRSNPKLSSQAKTITDHKISLRASLKQVGQDCNNFSNKTYWGNVKPYLFDPLSNTPKIIITPHLVRSLLLNLLIISVICIAIPILTNRNMFNQAISPSGYNRRLQPNQQDQQWKLNEKDRLLTTVSPRYVARKYSMYIFSVIWASYEIAFLTILLIGNPGYGDPISEKQLSIEQQKQIARFPQKRNLQGYSKCQICKSTVDNSVFHCPVCDLCCEGFSHHCEWIGKCVGYRNQLFLKAYNYGFFIGTIIMVFVIILQSIPYQ